MFVEAKELSKIPFHSIPISRRPDLLFYHCTQAMESQSILMNENDEPLGLDSLSKLHRSSKILRTVDSLLLYEPE